MFDINQCPHCDAEADLNETKDWNKVWFYVSCNGCGAKGHRSSSNVGAITRWNKCVTTTQPIDGIVEVLTSTLLDTRDIICDGATEGFNPHVGDWAERLFLNNGNIHDAVSGMEKAVLLYKAKLCEEIVRDKLTSMGYEPNLTNTYAHQISLFDLKERAATYRAIARKSNA